MDVTYTILITLPAIIFALLLPRKTNVPYSIKPTVTKTLIIANVLVHLVTQAIDVSDGSTIQRVYRTQTQLTQHSTSEQYYDIFGLTPSKIHAGHEQWRWIQLLTSNFLHADWLHLLFNLWFFGLFAINLENLLGSRKFAVFMAASMLCSSLAILFFTKGTDAFEHPHVGFSGVVYAVMAAYLVCFPRSKIEVVLIYNVFFWIAAICAASVGGVIAAILLTPSLGQLVGLGIFIGLFVLMQPGHVFFGVPAFVFLGIRVMQDALQLQSQQDEAVVSVWAHAGGFLAGIVAGLMANGARGMTQTWDEAKPPKPKPQAKPAKKRPSKAEAPPDQAAQEPERQAKAQLGRKVFQGEVNEMVDYYKNTIMPQFPNLTLDWQTQLLLARSLETREERDAALHAYDNLFREYPQVPGAETALLSAARLCRPVAGLHVKGLSYLDRFEGLPALMRERLEARDLRKEFAKTVQEAEAGQPRSPQMPVSRPARSQVESQAAPEAPSGPVDQPPTEITIPRNLEPAPAQAKDEPARSRDPEDDDARVRAFIERVEKLARKPGSEPSAGMSGWKARPLQSAPQQPESPSVRGTKPRHRPLEVGPDIVIDERRESLEREKRKLEISIQPDIEQSSQPIQLSAPLAEEPQATETDVPQVDPMQGDLYRDSPLAVLPTDKPAPHTVSMRSSLENLAGGPEANQTYSIILPVQSEVKPTVLIDYLQIFLGNRNRGEEMIRNGKGLILQGLSREQALTARTDLQRAGVPVQAVEEAHPALSNPPVEGFSVTVEERTLTVLAKQGSVKFSIDEISVLNLADVKPEATSGIGRRCMEIVGRNESGQYGRARLWERSFIASASLINGTPVPEDDALLSTFRHIAQHAPAGALTQAGRRALADTWNIVRFDSLPLYENYMTFCILSAVGRKLV